MALDQCPTCGRVSEDWSSNRTDQKGQVRRDNKDRMVGYRKWRRKWDRTSYVSDIDQIEWRVVNGEIVPVAVLEMTRMDGEMMPPKGYLDAIITRYTKRDGQAKSICHFAELLGVEAIIVLFQHNLENFWLYNLSTGTGWYHLTKKGYRSWLEVKKP